MRIWRRQRPPVISGSGSYDRSVERRVKRFFAPSERQELLSRSKKAFLALVPDLPEVGDDNPWLKSLVGVAFLSCLWKHLEAQGWTVSSMSLMPQRALSVMTEKMLIHRDIPALRDKLCSMEAMKFIAERSQKRRYAEDWICEAVKPEEDDAFTAGINVCQCPIRIVLEKQKRLEYFPYFCLNGYPMHAAMAVGLKRTQTLAHGADFCDFRLYPLERGERCIIENPEILLEFCRRKDSQ